MSRSAQGIPPETNRMIIDSLRRYPPEVAELAIKAIQLSEDLPEATVSDMLHAYVRELARKRGGEP